MTTNLYPGKWLKLTGDNTCVWNDIPLGLPENYTIEFDAVPQKMEDDNTKYSFRLLASENPNEFDYVLLRGKPASLLHLNTILTILPCIQMDAVLSEEIKMTMG